MSRSPKRRRDQRRARTAAPSSRNKSIPASPAPRTTRPGLDAPLLGMDVLSRLHWSQQGGVLRIDSAATP